MDIRCQLSWRVHIQFVQWPFRARDVQAIRKVLRIGLQYNMWQCGSLSIAIILIMWVQLTSRIYCPQLQWRPHLRWHRVSQYIFCGCSWLKGSMVPATIKIRCQLTWVEFYFFTPQLGPILHMQPTWRIHYSQLGWRPQLSWHAVCGSTFILSPIS